MRVRITTPPPPPLLPLAVLAGQDGTAPVRELRKANEILKLASALFAQAELGVTQCPEVCHVYPCQF
jgi:hypothetical protein